MNERDEESSGFSRGRSQIGEGESGSAAQTQGH